MEMEDDLGIKRGKKSKFRLPLKVYVIIKLSIIVSLPLLYFLCSPLLIFGVCAYIGLLFITKKQEKYMNEGLRKDLRVYLPKADSILCILLVILAIVGVVVGNVSTNQRKSPFEFMGQNQVEDKLEDFDFDFPDIKKSQTKQQIKNIGSLMTGTRYLFKEEKTFGGFGGFKMDMEKFSPPEGFEPPTDFERPDMNNMLNNMPFNILFQSIVKAGCTAILFIIVGVGLLSFIKIKKIYIKN